MTTAAGRDFLDLGDVRLEFVSHGATNKGAATFVLLHEGLGCVGLWGDFPERLAIASGARVVAYSREGYGASDPVALPRPLDYMQRHARDVLPRVLDRLGVKRFALVGHSDGASIAACYASATADARLRCVTLIAPHFFVEDMALAEIRNAKTAYEATDLRAKLARWHAHVDVAFRGWNDAWLDPAFKTAFEISDRLPRIAAPLQVIQGADDQYGTIAQVDRARGLATAPCETLIMPAVRHAPHREARDATIEAITTFAAKYL